jgi:hypothetical protein
MPGVVPLLRTSGEPQCLHFILFLAVGLPPIDLSLLESTCSALGQTMGRNLKLRVVAEGVETRYQCRFLRARKCDEGQGFYFSPPLPPEQFGNFLKEKRRMPR